MIGLALAAALLAPRLAGCAALTTHTAKQEIVAAPVPGLDACRVTGVMRPVAGSRIGFTLLLPRQWNGRLRMLGNGGYSSQLPLPQMEAAVRAGYAVTATDTGHDGDDPDFARGHPQAIVDWGWRAVHLTALAARRTAGRYYGRTPRWTYFIGCSTGGHQAFSEAQRFPADFDGIVAGAPGYDRVRLNAGFLWQYRSNHRAGDDAHPLLGTAQLALLHRGALVACAEPGARFITDPLNCRFDPATLGCRAGERIGCLDAAQVAAARAMYGGARRPDGSRAYWGWPAGSEPGWAAYWADPNDPQRPARATFWSVWAFADPHWSWWQFDFGRDLDRARATLGKDVDAASADLDRFRARGGRLLHYHGLADPVVPVADSVDYRDRLAARFGDRLDRFYRLFLVPGMAHCGGGEGPASIDAAAAIERWVEQGRAPDMLPAQWRAPADVLPLRAYRTSISKAD